MSRPCRLRRGRDDHTDRARHSAPAVTREQYSPWYRGARMRSRWSDVETRDLSELDALVYASRLIGAETSLVVWGGGNTSIKTTERDHRERPVDVLRVNGSGSDLRSIQRKDFPGVRMDDIRALLERQEMDDQAMVSYLARALQEPGGPRPSIETLLHGFVESRCVVHTHADAIVSLTNNDRAADTLEGVYGKDVIALDYRRPGFGISREVAEAIAGRSDARALVLAQHGTITWGATVREAYEATIELITRAEEAIAERKRGRRAFGGPRVAILPAAERRALALHIAPRLRGRLSRPRRQILGFDDDARVTEFVSSVEAPAVSQIGPATPRHTIYTKRLPCFVGLERADDATGGASGIGRAVARRLATEGAHVLVGDVDEAGAKKTAEEIIAAVGAGRALGLAMDVTNEASIRAAFEAAVLTWGGLDILVSNAGIAHSAPVAEMSIADWERSFAVNSTGHFLVAREAMRVMIAQGIGGALVFVATKNVMAPGKDFAAYSAAKAAEAQLAKVLALEGAPHGIRSNIVNPDAVFQDSRLWSDDVRRQRAQAQGITVDQLEDFYRKRNLLGARILPEDVAEAVLFLASDRSAKTTGCTITVDGGVREAFPR